MPVTTRIITPLSGSSRKPQSAPKRASVPEAVWKGSPASQVNWINWWVRSGTLASCATAPTENTKERSTMPGQKMLISNLPGPPCG